MFLGQLGHITTVFTIIWRTAQCRAQPRKEQEIPARREGKRRAGRGYQGLLFQGGVAALEHPIGLGDGRVATHAGRLEGFSYLFLRIISFEHRPAPTFGPKRVLAFKPTCRILDHDKPNRLLARISDIAGG